ncbi:MAG: bacteriohopanetetrol glucosamine biosynthesis glycosyltransferase HpnI [Candidatus Korobacteraceae bacterium]
MLKPLIHFAAYGFALLALCGLGYLMLSLWSEWRFLQRRRPARTQPAADRPAGCFTPPVSILKPLRGTDRQMHESFRSHCLQDYPQYEIVFGVNDANDEAVAEVERLRLEFPEHEIRLVICPEPMGSNRKVSNLAQMMKTARYEHIVVNDSDIRVERDYLQRILAPMQDAQVGMVTCLYRAEAGRSLASRMEAVTIATDFAGGVLCAVELEGGLHFGLGSTLAFPRAAADAIGGLEALVEYLADDHELGRMIADAGYKVVLSEVVVETFLPEYGWRAMFQHQLRWARTVRDLRKWGYVGVLLTFGLPWAMAAAVCAGGAPWSLALLAAVAVARFASGYLLCGPILNDRQTIADLWLIPARDVVGFAIWFASFGGDTIVWRGERFHLKDGKLTRA